MAVKEYFDGQNYITEENVQETGENKGLLGKLPSKLKITYNAICEDNYASNQELAVKTNQSERTIRNHTAELKDLHFIKSVGPDKGGHWEITGEE